MKSKTQSTTVTEALKRHASGEKEALNEVFASLYPELRRMARAILRVRGGQATLQPTALVHEAFLRLFQSRGGAWENRAHFLAASGRVMRHALINYAEKKRAQKRGGGSVILELDENRAQPEAQVYDTADLVEALTRLEEQDERKCRILELRFFFGFNIDEVAEILEISPATVRRDWLAAKLWLSRELSTP